MKGRKADDHAGLQPRVGLGARPIDPDLAGAQQLFQLALRDRQTPFDPAVEANPALLVSHCFVDNLTAHASTRFSMAKATMKAVTDAVTFTRA